MSCKISSASPIFPGILSQTFYSPEFHAIFFLKSMPGFEVPLNSGDWNPKIILRRDKSAQNGVKTLQTSPVHFLPFLSIILFKIPILLYYTMAIDIAIWTTVNPASLKNSNIIPLSFWVLSMLGNSFLLWKWLNFPSPRLGKRWQFHLFQVVNSLLLLNSQWQH